MASDLHTSLNDKHPLLFTQDVSLLGLYVPILMYLVHENDNVPPFLLSSTLLFVYYKGNIKAQFHVNNPPDTRTAIVIAHYV